VTLTADVGPCSSGTAIELKGHGFTFDLGGHTITGSGVATPIGIHVDSTASRITVRNGSVDHFDDGLVILGSKNVVSDIATFNSVLGIVWSAIGGSIRRVRAYDNSTVGLDLSNPSRGTKVIGFSALQNATGALVSRPATITRSFFTDNTNTGLSASGEDDVFTHNYFNANGGSGLLSSGDSPTVGFNIANYNASAGMETDPSVIDLGGNTAKGNGVAAQCSNVSCN
jgi:hypothetical protein